MSAKKQTNPLDSVRNATTGYIAVVLGIVCFIMALVAIAAVTRIVVGFGFTSGATTTAAATSSVSASSANAVDGTT